MKKLTFLAAAALMATSAFAGDHSIKATARMSWKSTSVNSPKSSNSKITAEFAHLNFDGKLNNYTNYYLDLNLAGTEATANSSYDATSGRVYSVGVVRTLSEGLTLNLGKQGFLVGGTEIMKGAEDQYATSYFYDQTYGLNKEFGATLAKNFMGQTLSVQLSNGNALARGNNGQSKYGWAAHWAGDLMGGMIKPSVGYTVRPGLDIDTNATDNVHDYRDSSALGVGAEFNFVPTINLALDYGLLKFKKGGTATADQKANSIVAMASYKGMELITPFVKFAKDTKKLSNTGSKSNEVTTMALGLELKEAKNDPIRYHAAFSSSEDKTTSTGAKSKTTTILVGAKFDANIL